MRNIDISGNQLTQKFPSMLNFVISFIAIYLETLCNYVINYIATCTSVLFVATLPSWVAEVPEWHNVYASWIVSSGAISCIMQTWMQRQSGGMMNSWICYLCDVSTLQLLRKGRKAIVGNLSCSLCIASSSLRDEGAKKPTKEELEILYKSYLTARKSLQFYKLR